MNTPAELLAKLNQYEDSGSAVAIYQEAAAVARAYKEVMQAALDCARSEAELTGAVHQKFEHGSAGWTSPKTPRLDRERWEQAIAADPELEEYQIRYETIKAALEDAQDRAGCLELPDPRFYIR